MARNKAKFKGRKHSTRGIFALVIGIVSLIGLIIMSIISSTSAGMGGGELGVVGIGCFAVSVTGFLFTLKSLKERDVYLVLPIVSLIVNAITMLIFFVLYLIGIPY